MIKLIEVSKEFKGRQVLQHINLVVHKGETLVIIGGSGSGKSTLLRMMIGLIPPSSGEIWIKDAFSPQIVLEVMEGLEGVVNNPEGTGYGACREDIRLAGKTGTAELKATKEDTSGTEIGWFTVFTTDRDTENPILLISMVENVKDIGGSGYVVEKGKAILDEYLGNE